MGGRILQWVPGTGRGFLELSVKVGRNGQKSCLLMCGGRPTLWLCHSYSILGMQFALSFTSVQLNTFW